MSGSPELVPVLEAHRFNEPALGRFLHGRLPGFEGAPEIKQFQGGQSNPTFHVRASAGEWVLRKKPPGKLLPSAHAVEREYRILHALQGSGVPVPRVHLLCEDASVIGTAFFVMDHVPGRVFPDRVMLDGTATERAAVYAELARVLAALHRVDWRAAGLEGFGRPDGYMARQVARWTTQWAAAKVEEMPEMDRLAAWLPTHLPPDDETTIAHGDYRLGNVILHPAEPRILAVLDWELATLGHPLADLAYTCLTYHLPPGAEGVSGIDGVDGPPGLPSQTEFVAQYCAAAQRPVPPALDAFVVFSMFRLASIIAGVWRRALDGNAADPRALGYRDRYRGMAERGWQIAQRIDGAR